jgi:hypothetical protein
MLTTPVSRRGPCEGGKNRVELERREAERERRLRGRAARSWGGAARSWGGAARSGRGGWVTGETARGAFRSSGVGVGGGGDGMRPGGLGGIFFGDARDQFFGRTLPGRGAKLDLTFSLGPG